MEKEATQTSSPKEGFGYRRSTRGTHPGAVKKKKKHRIAYRFFCGKIKRGGRRTQEQKNRVEKLCGGIRNRGLYCS